MAKSETKYGRFKTGDRIVNLATGGEFIVTNGDFPFNIGAYLQSEPCAHLCLSHLGHIGNPCMFCDYKSVEPF